MTHKATTARPITPLPRHPHGLTRVVVASTIVLLVAAGSIWAITHSTSNASNMREVVDLDLGRAEIGSFTISTTAMGELEARNQIELRSELDTRAGIVEIVAEGSVVKKGDLLVQLNAEQLQDQIVLQNLEVDRAQADVTAAENSLKIQLSENESRERAGQLKIDLAELALAQWRQGEVVKTRAKQVLDYEQAERDLKRLKEQFERSVELLAEGLLSQNQHDLDEIAYINAVAKLETSKLDRETYEEYQYPRDEKTKISDLEEAKADLERIRTQNKINAGAKESSLGTTRRQFDLKRERLDKLNEQVNLATITAPTDGLVVYATSLGRGRDMMMMGSDGPLQVGREIRPNEMLIVLPDTTSMIASVRVHEALVGRIQPGQRVRITIDAINGETFLGTVESVGVLAETGGWRDPNRREYTVRIGLDYDNTDGKLKPSMRAEAEIMLGTVQDSLMVPVQAVFNEGPVRFVLVPRGSRYERVPVKIGRMSDTYAQIISGIEEGDQVLLREPDTGELLASEWTAEQLEAVGVKLDAEGNQVLAKRGAAMMRMMNQMDTNRGKPDNAARGKKQRPGTSQKPDGDSMQKRREYTTSDSNSKTRQAPTQRADTDGQSSTTTNHSETDAASESIQN